MPQGRLSGGPSEFVGLNRDRIVRAAVVMYQRAFSRFGLNDLS
jgi:hypothetical protein